MEKMRFETVDGTVRNIDKIAEMFPQVVTEVLGEDGKPKRAVKWDVLKQLLSGDYVEGGECYEFTWPGKRAAIAEAAKPIRKTLRPCKEESKNWDTTENLYIEGDNLEVLKLLQESYLGKVKMIYIDPPYNTGNDFVYKDNFTKDKETSEDELGLFDEETEDRTMSGELFKNTESNGRFHSDWCSMMYPRLQIAKDLLADDGVIFISIDDNEVENLKKICDEIWGRSNFIGQWNWYKSATPPNLSKKIKKNIEYILCYEKNRTSVKYRGIQKTSPSSNGLMNQTNRFAALKFPADVVETGLADGIYKAGRYGTANYEINLLNDVEVKNGIFVTEFTLEGKFKWGQTNLSDEIKKGTKIAIRTNTFSPSYEKLEYDPEVPPNFIDKNVNVDTTEQAGKLLSQLFDGVKVFDYPKPVDLITYLTNFICSKNDIIIDFFSGSATTAHAVMKLNAEDGGKRKFIMVQLPEVCEAGSEAAKAGYKNICEIGKERIRRAGEKIKEEAGLAAADLDIGFRVFKVADSNMKDVYYSANEYSQGMLDSLVSNIKEDRTDLDLLYGCLLDWGVELSLPHTSETIDGVTVHTVDNGALIACFDANIPESAIRTIAKRQPLRAVFRDSSFSSAPQKINVEEIFKLLSPTTTVKVI